MKPDIVVVNPLYQPVMEALAQSFTLHRLWEAPDRQAFFAGLKDKARGLVSFSAPVTAAMMAALPRLEIIAAMSVGVDNIDLAVAKAAGIVVTNAPDVLTDDVADLAVLLLLSVARRLPQADRFVRGGLWRKRDFPYATKLGGATMGVLGLGRIGAAIARRAEAFGVRIVYCGTRRKADVAYPFYEDLVAMARDVDYLMVSCPGGAATRHLVDEAVIAALGSEGALINIARGSVVDEAALVRALVEGRLGAAGLDVFADEPNVPAGLLPLENVVLTPHIGSATHATRRAMGQLMIDNLLAHYAGKPLLTRCA